MKIRYRLWPRRPGTNKPGQMDRAHAHRILDRVMIGQPATAEQIRRALLVTGDAQ